MQKDFSESEPGPPREHSEIAAFCLSEGDISSESPEFRGVAIYPGIREVSPGVLISGMVLEVRDGDDAQIEIILEEHGVRMLRKALGQYLRRKWPRLRRGERRIPPGVVIFPRVSS